MIRDIRSGLLKRFELVDDNTADGRMYATGSVSGTILTSYI